MPRLTLHGIQLAGLCGALAVSACSSDATSPGAAGAPSSMAGSTSSMAGSTSVAGAASSGAPGTAGSTGTGTGGSGGASAGAGGDSSSSGGSSSGAAGASGGSSGAAGAVGNAGASGAAGAAGAGGGSAGAGGGSGNCIGAGHALFLGGNTTGADPAKQNVNVDLGSDLPIGAAARTIETWAYMHKADWAGNVNTLFYYGTTANRNAPAFGFDFGGTAGTIDPFTNGNFDNDNRPAGLASIDTSQWVHFAMVYDPSVKTVFAYVNGVLASSKKADSTDPAHSELETQRSNLTIGGYPAPDNNFFSSYMDEFRVWKIARSAADIMSTMHKTLVGNEPGLVGYWQFNESSGSTAADSVTTAGHTAHVGTLMGTPLPTFAVPNPPAPVSCP